MNRSKTTKLVFATLGLLIIAIGGLLLFNTLNANKATEKNDIVNDTVAKEGETLATDVLYKSYNSSGTFQKSSNNLQTAIDAAGAGGRVDVMSNIQYNSSIYTIKNSLTINLNGYKLYSNSNSPFITHTYGSLTINGSGKIENRGGGPVIKGTSGQSYRSGLYINNAWLEAKNDGAIYGEATNIEINNSTIESGKNYAAIYARSITGYTYSQKLVIKGNSTVYAIFAGYADSEGGDVYIQGGLIKRTKENGMAIGEPAKKTTFYITGGQFEANQSAINKYNSYNENKSKYRFVKVGNDLYKVNEYTNIKYDLKGGKFKNYFAPPYIHYVGTTTSLPDSTKFGYREEQGIKFSGWYLDSNYNDGPYSGIGQNDKSNRTVYAKYTYNVVFDKNGSAENPVLGSISNQTFIAGTGTSNKLPKHNLTRNGYKFKGWSLNKDGSNLWASGTKNYDTSVNNGSITLYAIWEAGTLESSYKVEYYFEDLSGNYIKDSSKDTRFYSTAGNISNPTIGVFDGYKISEKEDHVKDRNITVKGDNTGIVKLYYELKTYKVDFKDVDNNIIAPSQVVKHKGSAVAPTAPDKQGYEFVKWDKSLSNITSDLVIKPIYIANKYEYMFDHNMGKDAKTYITQTYDQELKLPKTPVYSGKIFLGWFDKEGNPLKNDVIDSIGNKEFIAKWKSGKPSQKINLKQQTDSALIFSNYENYEYQLIETGTDEINNSNWIIKGGKSYTNLKPNTEYELFIRLLGGSNFEPSDVVKVGSFRTLSNFNVKIIDITDTKIKIEVPTLNMIYVLNDSNNQEIGYKKATQKNGKYVLEYDVKPSSEYSLGIKIEKGIEGNIDYTEKDLGFSKIHTLNEAKEFSGENSISELLNSSGNITIKVPNKDYEYQIGDGEWKKADQDGKITFTLDVNSSDSNIYVRNEKTETTAASLRKKTIYTSEGKADAPHLTDEEITHLLEVLSDGTRRVLAKEGYSYTSDNNIINVENGYIYFKDKTPTINRNETTIYKKSASREINSLSRLVLSEDDKKVDLVVKEDVLEMMITNPKVDVKYQLRNGSNIVEGIFDDGKVYFTNLQPGTNYELYIQKISNSNPYSSEYTYIKTEKTGVQPIEINEDGSSEYTPNLDYDVDYSEQTRHRIIVKTKIGYDYKYNEMTRKGDGTVWFIEGLDPVTNYDIEVRLNNDQYISNYIKLPATTTKIPKEFVKSIDQTLELVIEDEKVEIKNPLEGYEYAIVKSVDKINENSLNYISGEKVIFDNLQYATSYVIYTRKIETQEEEASSSVMPNINNQDKKEFKTDRLRTEKVELPNSLDIEKVLKSITKNSSSILVKSVEGIEYLLLKQGESITPESVWKKAVSLEKLNIGEIYQLYIRKSETNSKYESNEASLPEIRIEKDSQELVSKEVEVISSTHNTITYKQEIGYDYSIDGIEWFTARYNGNQSFRELNSGTEYEIYVRLSETEDKQASNQVSGNKASTYKKPSVEVKVEVDVTIQSKDENYLEFKVVGNESDLVYEYSLDQQIWIKANADIVKFEHLLAYTSYTLYARTLENEYQYESRVEEVGQFRTMAKPVSKENSLGNLQVTENTIKFNLIDGYEYFINESWVQREILFAHSIDNLEPGQIVEIIVKRTEEDKEVKLQLQIKERGIIDEDFKIEITEILDESITIKVRENYLYTIVIGQNENYTNYIYSNEEKYTFTGLNPFTSYQIYAKKMETDTKLESLPIKKEVMTKKLSAEKRKALSEIEMNATVKVTNQSSHTIFALDGLEYVMVEKDTIPGYDAEFLKGEEGELTFTKIENFVIYVRRSETEDKEAGNYIVATSKQRKPDPKMGENRVTVDVNANNIVLSTKDVFEYSLDGNTWSKDKLDTLPNTKYKLFVRTAGDSNILPSNTVEGIFILNEVEMTEVTTPKEKVDVKLDTIKILNVDSNFITIKGETDYEYSLDQKDWKYGESVRLEVIDINLEPKIYVRIKESHDRLWSEVKEINKIIKYNPDFIVLDIDEIKHNEIKLKTNTVIKDIKITKDGEAVTNLLPNTGYKVYALIDLLYENWIEKNEYQVYTVNGMNYDEVITTKKTPTELVILTEDEKIATVEDTRVLYKKGYEFVMVPKDSTAKPEDIISSSELEGYSPETHTLYIRKLETQSDEKSNYFEAKVKAYQTAPDGVTLSVKTVTDQSIEIEKLSLEYEYSVNLTDWYNSDTNVIFKNLNPNTEYKIYVRKRATENLSESEAILTEYVITNNEGITKEELTKYINSFGIKDNQIFDELLNQAIEENYLKQDISSINKTIDAYKEKLDKVAINSRQKELEELINRYDEVGLTDEELAPVKKIIDTYKEKMSSIDIKDVDSIENNISNAIKELDHKVLDLLKDKTIKSFDEKEKQIIKISDELRKDLNDHYDLIKEAQTVEELKELKNKVNNLIENQLWTEEKAATIEQLDKLVTNSSDEVKKLFDKAKDAINKANTKEESQKIYNKYLDEIKKQTVLDIQKEFEKELKKYLEDNGNTLDDKYQDIINEYKNNIDWENHNDLQKLEKDAKQELDKYTIEESKKQTIQDLEEYSIKLELIKSFELYSYEKIKNELIGQIKEKESKEDITVSLNKAKVILSVEYLKNFVQGLKVTDDDLNIAKIISRVEKDIEGLSDDKKLAMIEETLEEIPLHIRKKQVVSDLEEVYHRLLEKNKYSENNKNQLKEVLFESKMEINSQLTVDNLEKLKTQSIENMYNVLAQSISKDDIDPMGNLIDLEENKNKDILKSGVSNNKGLKGDTTITIKVTQYDNLVEAFKKALLQGDVALGQNMNIKDIKNQVIGKTLDVYLEDQNGKVTNYDGVYKVALLIPSDIREYENLRVVHYADGKFEVLESQKEGNYLIFDTTSFSPYFIIGDKISYTNLWWAIALVSLIIVSETAYIVIKKRGDRNVSK